jgi:hypothetical protein
MKKTFNLKKHRKTAFYEGARGYAQAATRAMQICYKCKTEDGTEAQDAWNDCLNEYNEATAKGDWVEKYAGFTQSKDRLNAKTPAVQEIVGKKEEK